jgi:hypothetical protein
MGFYIWRKIIAITVLSTFIGTGLARASESTPQFQEKAGAPMVKKQKKFPLLLVAGGLVVLGAVVYLVTKKKKDDPTPPPVQETTYTFEVYDQMEANVHKTFDKKAKAGTTLTVTTTDADISDVVADYISVQDTSGKTLESSKTGTVTFTPVSGTKFKVIRYHAGPGFKEVYDWLASQNSLQLYAGRESTWGRKDYAGVTGNENVWTGTIQGVKGGLIQVNEVLATPFKLGSVTFGGTQNWYGFKIEAEGGKDLSQRWIYVNPQKPEPQQVRTALSEIIEYLGAVGNMLGVPSQTVICDDQSNVLNDKGKAALRFIFAYCK